jgi:predicted XRE-type DNA-binding protein
MKTPKLKTVRGSGNVFRDLGRENAEVLRLKALLAAEIIRALDDGDLTVRKAESLTHIVAADFSRIRNANPDRFTVDRLMTILDHLGRGRGRCNYRTATPTHGRSSRARRCINGVNDASRAVNQHL